MLGVATAGSRTTWPSPPQTLALRDEELSAHEETLREQREELQQLYANLGLEPCEAAPPKERKSALGGKGGDAEVSWRRCH